MIKTLIVDDEPLARKRIRRLLASESDIDVVGECSNARQAHALLRESPADLLFLDVQMPQGNGFSVLEQLDPGPLVIFVTAYEEYALQAFEVHAHDYLLKPFEEARFRAAVRRARETLQFGQAPTRTMDAVLVPAANRIVVLKTCEIDWIETADNYVRLHAGSNTHILRGTLAAFEAKLEPSRFARIHRSTIVNVDRIIEFQPWFNGDFLVVLNGGQQLKMSRTYRDRVQDILGHSI